MFRFASWKLNLGVATILFTGTIVGFIVLGDNLLLLWLLGLSVLLAVNSWGKYRWVEHNHTLFGMAEWRARLAYGPPKSEKPENVND